MSTKEKKGGKIMVKSTRNKWMGLCAAAVFILAVMAVLPQAVCAQNATYEGNGNGLQIYSRYYGGAVNSTIFKINVSGTLYDAYCIDLYTSINVSDNLTVNGSLAEDTRNINWSAVNYILHNYTGNTNLEAAAIQAAIWYYCTEPYGNYSDAGGPENEYQFMTDPIQLVYDGRSYVGDPSSVRVRAFVIINDTIANASDFKFPTEIQLNSSQDYVLVDHSVNLTATVRDQNNTVIPNVTVKFAITNGTGTLNPDNGTTDSSGQVTVNFTKTGGDSATVAAWIEGNYGTLLRGDVLYPSSPVQNVSTITIIPHTIEDLILLPVPELPTVVLMSTGLLALMGYVVYSRRRKEQ
jgi:hypothetical protein